VNIVTVSFNPYMGQMTKMSQWKKKPSTQDSWT